MVCRILKTTALWCIFILPIFSPFSSAWNYRCNYAEERNVHEEICSLYYECSEDVVGNWVIQVKGCPLGRIFDDNLKRCIDGECPSVPTSTQCYFETIKNNWNFECSRALETHPHEKECTYFYECFEDEIGNWLITLLQCSIGKYYDALTSKCIIGECSNPTPPSCGSSEPFYSTTEMSMSSSDFSIYTPSPSSSITEEQTTSSGYTNTFPTNWYTWTSSAATTDRHETSSERPSTTLYTTTLSTSERTTLIDLTTPTSGSTYLSTLSTRPTDYSTYQTTEYRTSISTDVPPPGFKCPDVGTFPDPYNCQNYYICRLTPGGLVPTRYTCNFGNNFCLASKECGSCPCFGRNKNKSKY